MCIRHYTVVYFLSSSWSIAPVLDSMTHPHRNIHLQFAHSVMSFNSGSKLKFLQNYVVARARKSISYTPSIFLVECVVSEIFGHLTQIAHGNWNRHRAKVAQICESVCVLCNGNFSKPCCLSLSVHSTNLYALRKMDCIRLYRCPSVCLSVCPSKDTSFLRDNSKSFTAINFIHGI